jgi:urate oxidase
LKAQISYGKGNITLYRTYAAPLSGITPIPESAYAGRDNTLFSVDVTVEVFGDNFMPAYTEGDNRNVVATDTMKNFVTNQALGFQAATLEGFLHFLGERFLETYPQMQSLRLTGKEQPFDAVRVPTEDGVGFTGSNVLFSRSHNDYAFATLSMERDEQGASVVTDHRCGRLGMQLIKVTGSAFAQFARDEFTTLPERIDRPLFIYLDAYWKYVDVAQMVGQDLSRYITADQVRDFCGATFHRFVSMSIQHLIHEMGTGLLERFPQMAEVSFEAQNRLWDTAFISDEDERVKVYVDPRPPYGMITLRLTR